jgi:predicted DCC family thiol-disulfide oxidoreductase YuxK
VNAEVLVIYDAACRFCRFGIHIVRRLDRRGVLEYCPFGHPVAEERLAALPADARYEQMHVATSAGLLSGTDAARVVLNELPLGRLAVALGLHGLYPLVVRSRWLLGRLSPQRDAIVSCSDASRPKAARIL